MAKQKYVVASLNRNEDYGTAYPIDIVYTDDSSKLTRLFEMYRKKYKYPAIYRERTNGEFTYQTSIKWHLGET